MSFTALFAITDLKPIDPDITAVFVFIMVSGVIILIGVVLWHFVPQFASARREKRTEKLKADNAVWFDADEATLHRGSLQFKVQESSIEFYVCKLVFEEKNKYQLDINVLKAAGDDPLKQRAVYQAVTRLNKKVKSELGIDGLFIRGKEKTSLNTNYR